eukprot:11836354-Alexandrium_andersonii.AAC.1
MTASCAEALAQVARPLGRGCRCHRRRCRAKLLQRGLRTVVILRVAQHVLRVHERSGPALAIFSKP